MSWIDVSIINNDYYHYTRKIILVSILYGGNHSSKFFKHHVFNTHMKSNIAQRLLLFPSNKHKKCEMQKHKDSDNISVKCKYCN
jgi:hypothetical protein